ncbi:MAG: pnp [Alphaproteobacteria bacterium]|jgi:polyribonucleotide nucleotidyltransferase|nr:pnp [Alphaproteobacteria bacterium]
MSNMFKMARQELNWANRKLVLETGKIARQADGAVLVTYGETTVLCTVVAHKEPNPNVDFFPLTVHYQEKVYAVGRIPGGFFKREGRPSEKEVLTSRLVDRPIRPLFPEGFRNETQVICTVLSHDLENDPDVVALIGASAALAISGVPFLGPVGAARVGFKDGDYILNPTPTQLTNSQLDLILAGTADGVLMVESEAQELSEDIMLGAVEFGHKAFQPIIEAIKNLKAAAGKEDWGLPLLPYDADAIYTKVKKVAEKDLRKAYSITTKQDRYAAIAASKAVAKEKLLPEVENETALGHSLKALESDILRTMILEEGKRVDGRDLPTIRPIVCETGLLPRTHGSALFTRGETQALVITTLGTGHDEQLIDALQGEYRERFMLHYNFPPYSVGEVGRMSSPGRREVGHGKLAWRAIRSLLPSKEQFPYTVRTVSEVTESNGSSSMATVCGASLSMMDAGVPLTRPVAGIAMGLIKEGTKFAILSDILGDEDHLGDMDFKVAGTTNGVTALQMDIKITSITHDIMRLALEQARLGRLHILEQMSKEIQSSRESVSTHAPRMVTITIPKDKIRDIIGPGGKMIREICETTGAKIDIEDDGTVNISAVDAKAIDAALNTIRGIACDPEIGGIYVGKVVKIMDFGAFVNFMGNRDGLVHISELSPERVAKVSDIVKEGDMVRVKVVGFDDRGKVKLSMKSVPAEEGASG